MAKSYKQSNDFINSIKYFEKYIHLADTLFTQDKIKAIEELETKYQTEKKDLQLKAQSAKLDAQQQRNNFLTGVGVSLTLLLILVGYGFMDKRRTNQKLTLQNEAIRLQNEEIRQQNEEIQQQNDEIQRREEEKTLLLRELHHRVKNNLYMVSSMLKLQAGQLNDPQAVEAVSQSRQRLDAISLVHNELYRDERNISNVNMLKYITELLNNMKQAFGLHQQRPLEVNVRIEDMTLDVESAIPIGLIINELLTNSLKYAFTGVEQPVISVALEQPDPERLHLIIADNGPGLPPDFDLKEAKSFGLRLVHALTRQLKAKYQIETHNGTQFIFDIYYFKSTSTST